MTANEFEALPQKSRQFLAYTARKFADGWTGKWEVVVQDGGVRDFKETGAVKLESPPNVRVG